VVAAQPVVYIVDDDVSVRRALIRLIRSVGLEPIAFASAEAFLQTDPPQQPCCLVLDVRLSGMTGLELLEQLAASGASLPAILITAHDDAQVRARASHAGVIAYLRKPFDDEALLAAIQQALGGAPGGPP
jgi:two-component system, LuxR family, response regulator FixJ